MEEIWKDIDGFEGLYQVSNLGNVRSLKRSLLLKTKNYSISSLSQCCNNIQKTAYGYKWQYE